MEMIAVSSAHGFGKCKKSEHDVEKKKGVPTPIFYYTDRTSEANKLFIIWLQQEFLAVTMVGWTNPDSLSGR